MGKHNFSEVDLVAGFNARTPEAYEQWYSRFYNTLFYASFRITRDSLESEDIVRYVFVDLYTTHRHVQFKSFNTASYYIYVAVKNRSISFWRAHGQRNAGESFQNVADGDVAEMLSAKYGETLWNLRYDQVEGILESVNRRFIKVLKLIYLEQKSTDEIAELMGIEKQTVLNLKTLGLKRVGQRVKEAKISLGPFLLLLFLYKW
jgi:RNA polymerase sigma factor (sigma-70 family)